MVVVLGTRVRSRRRYALGVPGDRLYKMDKSLRLGPQLLSEEEACVHKSQAADGHFLRRMPVQAAVGRVGLPPGFEQFPKALVVATLACQRVGPGQGVDPSETARFPQQLNVSGEALQAIAGPVGPGFDAGLCVRISQGGKAAPVRREAQCHRLLPKEAELALEHPLPFPFGTFGLPPKDSSEIPPERLRLRSKEAPPELGTVAGVVLGLRRYARHEPCLQRATVPVSQRGSQPIPA